MPKARSLSSAVRRDPAPVPVAGSRAGDVLVVCKGTRGAHSLALLRASVREARKKGYRLRPSQPKLKLSKRRAQRLLAINAALAAQCDYRSVQAAVRRREQRRILIMPGRYTEPASRKAPENDPKCNPSLLQRDASGDLTPSYEYQVRCPNDQNLIHAGRAVKGEPPVPPRSDRRGSRGKSSAGASGATCRSRAQGRSPRT